MSNLLRDYVALSQFNYLYPVGTLPSNFFFRKPSPYQYELANQIRNEKLALSMKPSAVNTGMIVDVTDNVFGGRILSSANNVNIVDASEKAFDSAYSDNCSTAQSRKYHYSFLAENDITLDRSADGVAKIALNLKNVPIPAAFIKNHVKTVDLRNNPSTCSPCDPGQKPGFQGQITFTGKNALGQEQTTVLQASEASDIRCIDMPSPEKLGYSIEGQRLMFYWMKTHTVENVRLRLTADIIETPNTTLLSPSDPFNISVIDA